MRESARPWQDAYASPLCSDALGEALGAEVRVPAQGSSVQMGFSSAEEALDFARRLRIRAAA